MVVETCAMCFPAPCEVARSSSNVPYHDRFRSRTAPACRLVAARRIQRNAEARSSVRGEVTAASVLVFGRAVAIWRCSTGLDGEAIHDCRARRSSGKWHGYSNMWCPQVRQVTPSPHPTKCCPQSTGCPDRGDRLVLPKITLCRDHSKCDIDRQIGRKGRQHLTEACGDTLAATEPPVGGETVAEHCSRSGDVCAR